MDGSFACPECGTEVEVRGIAPGRQVRCGFCDRLLEVPYLPRVPDGVWKRRRYARPKWVGWAWIALVGLTGVIAVAGLFRFLTRQYESARERSISRLLDSSRRHEFGGRLGQALVDLDAALELARAAGPDTVQRLKNAQRKRPDLARSDAQHVLDGLVRAEPPAFRLGDWLNLIARAENDPDLAPLAIPIAERFGSALDARVGFELAAARRALDSGDLVAALTYCEQIAGLFDHLGPAKQTEARSQTEALVKSLLMARGIKVEPPQGRFVFGSTSYVSELLPALTRALEAKGYLPGRESSPWRYLWSQARFHARLEVSETLEGSYLSSPNRLTRIEARLTLSDRSELIWQTSPVARSQVPLPRLPAYLANRVATSPQRSEEFERLLYDSARNQVDEKFAYALQTMPTCRPSAPFSDP
jgi:hypothetical protein